MVTPGIAVRFTNRLAAAGALTAALAAASPALAAAPPDRPQAHNPFGPAYEAVARSRLAGMRGGFVTPTGVEIKVGIAVTGTVTGPDVPDFEFTVGRRITNGVKDIREAASLEPGGGQLTFHNETLKVAGGAANGGVTVNASADTASGLKTLLQAGAGNSAPALSAIGGEGLTSVIQNNLNNISIDLTNQIDLETSMNVGGNLNDRIADAVRTIQAAGF